MIGVTRGLENQRLWGNERKTAATWLECDLNDHLYKQLIIIELFSNWTGRAAF